VGCGMWWAKDWGFKISRAVETYGEREGGFPTVWK
jgi:hypothetical protein